MRLSLSFFFAASFLVLSGRLTLAQLSKRSIPWPASLQQQQHHHSVARQFSEKRQSGQESNNNSSITLVKRKKKHHHGKASYYGAGNEACGGYDSSNDHIGALSKELFQAGQHCGRRVKVTAVQNGQKKEVIITIRDMCPSCDKYKLDLSKGAFEKLANPDEGVIQVTWFFLD